MTDLLLHESQMFPGRGPIRPYRPKVSHSAIDGFIAGESISWTGEVIDLITNIWRARRLRRALGSIRSVFKNIGRGILGGISRIGQAVGGAIRGIKNRLRGGFDDDDDDDDEDLRKLAQINNGIASNNKTLLNDQLEALLKKKKQERVLSEMNSFQYFVSPNAESSEPEQEVEANKNEREPLEFHLHSHDPTEKEPEISNFPPEERVLRDQKAKLDLFDNDHSFKVNYKKKQRELDTIRRRKITRRVKKRVRVKVNNTTKQEVGVESMAAARKRREEEKRQRDLAREQDLLQRKDVQDFMRRWGALGFLARNLIIWKRVRRLNRQLRATLSRRAVYRIPPEFLVQKTPYSERNEEQYYIRCANQRRNFFKSYLLFNPEKLKFCSDTLQSLREFPINDTITYLENGYLSEITSLQEIKKGFYCAICDARLQKYFINTRQKLVVYEQGFCKDLLVTFKSYIFWKNFFMVQYLDMMLQLVSCTNLPGNVYEFPFRSAMGWQRRRVNSIKRCYDNLEKPDFMRHCLFICSQYNLIGFSNFFEGNVVQITNIYYRLLDYLRQRLGVTPMHFSQIQKTLDTNKKHELFNRTIDELAPRRRVRPTVVFDQMTRAQRRNRTRTQAQNRTETQTQNQTQTPRPAQAQRRRARRRPVNETALQLERQRRREEEMLMSNPEFAINQRLSRINYHEGDPLPTKRYSELDMNADRYKEEVSHRQIFEKNNKPYPITRLRPFYSSFKKGINPLKMSESTNFDIDLVQLINFQRQKSKTEKLAPTVLGQYFSVDRDDISNFNKDLDTKVEFFRTFTPLNERAPHTAFEPDEKWHEEDKEGLKMPEDKSTPIDTPDYISDEVGDKSNDDIAHMMKAMFYRTP